MINDPVYQKLREMSWRRKLEPREEALLSEWLAAHPEIQPDWESETSLTELLTALPNVPVASNFTQRVLTAARREASANEPLNAPVRPGARWWTRWKIGRASCRGRV